MLRSASIFLAAILLPSLDNHPLLDKRSVQIKVWPMNILNIHDATEWFEVLHTTAQSQSAVMTLKPGHRSSERTNVHKKSDQIVLVVEGEIEAEIAGEKRLLHSGDTCIVPAGTPHRFENAGKGRAVTFNVYTPPEYAYDEKG